MSYTTTSQSFILVNLIRNDMILIPQLRWSTAPYSPINRTDTTISRSKQLDSAIPPSKISSLSSGQFVGMVVDNPDQKIELKAIQCEILNDHDA